MHRSILLSFDVEEFDMPLDYKQAITLQEQLHIGKLGLDAITPILNDKSIATTLFTTATYAIHFPYDIKALAQQHEIASHTYYHSNFEDDHLLSSRLALEAITHTPVTGLRMPRMRKVAMNEVIKAGYRYDSSINPTFLPGKYNNLHLPRTIYSDAGMTRIPASVTPNFRVPLFWLAFKNMPYFLFKSLVIQTLKKDGYVCLYFHPWEFTDATASTALPTFTKRWCGKQLTDRLYRLVNDLKKEGELITITDFMSHKH